MFINSTGNITQARSQAEANANWTGVPWVIYTDTSGNVRICRQLKQPNQGVIETVYPCPPAFDGLICGDCLRLSEYSEEKFTGKVKCDCGGEFCGGPHCRECARIAEQLLAGKRGDISGLLQPVVNWTPQYGTDPLPLG